MAGTIVAERSTIGGPWAGPAAPWQSAYGPSAAPISGNFTVMPRCKLEFEKCNGGFKINCSCEDEVACAQLQNLCNMLCDGTCSCSACCNGIQICQCNLALGFCHCENTKDGVCITCTSADKKCAEMIQACCDCIAACSCQPGCCCYISFKGTPVCCGTC
jgi:hypothetical protein